MKLLLRPTSGSHAGETFTVQPGECVTFGRTTASQWSFSDDGHMSSVHFEIENFGDRAEIRDRASTNGTWLNNSKIQRQYLKQGDRLRAGTTVMVVECIESSAPIDAEKAKPGRATFETSDGPPSMQQPRASQRISSAVASKSVAAPSGPASFDSVHVLDQDPLPPPPKPMQASRLENEFPIQSAPAIQEQDALVAQPALQPQPLQVAQAFQLLAKRTNTDSAETLIATLDQLAPRWSIQLAIHYQKIRMMPPADLPVRPLFPWLANTSASQYSPVRASWTEAKSKANVYELLPRLIKSDGFVAFLGASGDQVAVQIHKMFQLGVEGFSDPYGFLPACWPSGLAMIFALNGPSIANELFADRIQAALLCTPGGLSRVVCVANPDVAGELCKLGFEVVDRLFDGLG